MIDHYLQEKEIKEKFRAGYPLRLAFDVHLKAVQGSPLSTIDNLAVAVALTYITGSNAA